MEILTEMKLIVYLKLVIKAPQFINLGVGAIIINQLLEV